MAESGKLKVISRISGKIRKSEGISVLLDVSGICYEILVPPTVMKTLKEKTGVDGSIEFVTYHYYQVDSSRSIPMLIGFMSEVEREFFEEFISVSGVGPKAACKALTLPISVIADAIDKGDIGLLKTLPGVGGQRARQIIAKLQNKVGKFGLIQDKHLENAPAMKSDARDEAVSVLLQLQYKKKEADDMVNNVLARNPKASTCEEILNEVYKQKGTRG
ncbi:MAG: Holliday junction branch migration protein RuvA [Candidatus Omnitrophota bacterium]